ncbi:hypothetical protein [Staphylococcus saccharolyticus]
MVKEEIIIFHQVVCLDTVLVYKLIEQRIRLLSKHFNNDWSKVES